METNEKMIAQTRNWVQKVVSDTNFCPFAAQEIKRDTIHYELAPEGNLKASLALLLMELERLDAHPELETTLLIFPYNYAVFADYLKLVNKSENHLLKNGYEGIYQLASFHPLYCFEGADEEDAANYTNRSIYPMLHIIREESMERALEKYPDPEGIPERNIDYARTKGLAYMKLLREGCL